MVCVQISRMRSLLPAFMSALLRENEGHDEQGEREARSGGDPSDRSVVPRTSLDVSRLEDAPFFRPPPAAADQAHHDDRHRRDPQSNVRGHGVVNARSGHGHRANRAQQGATPIVV